MYFFVQIYLLAPARHVWMAEFASRVWRLLSTSVSVCQVGEVLTVSSQSICAHQMPVKMEPPVKISRHRIPVHVHLDSLGWTVKLVRMVMMKWKFGSTCHTSVQPRFKYDIGDINRALCAKIDQFHCNQMSVHIIDLFILCPLLAYILILITNIQIVKLQFLSTYCFCWCYRYWWMCQPHMSEWSNVCRWNQWI